MDFPYDQPLEGEKPHRFKGFMRYRDMEPPRSIEKLHRSCMHRKNVFCLEV